MSYNASPAPGSLAQDCAETVGDRQHRRGPSSQATAVHERPAGRPRDPCPVPGRCESCLRPPSPRQPNSLSVICTPAPSQHRQAQHQVRIPPAGRTAGSLARSAPAGCRPRDLSAAPGVPVGTVQLELVVERLGEVLTQLRAEPPHPAQCLLVRPVRGDQRMTQDQPSSRADSRRVRYRRCPLAKPAHSAPPMARDGHRIARRCAACRAGVTTVLKVPDFGVSWSRIPKRGGDQRHPDWAGPAG